MRLNVGFLLHANVGYSRVFDFDHPQVTVGGDLGVTALRGSLRLTRTTRGLYAQGRLEGEVRLECVRCLQAYDQTLATDLDDLFVYPPGRAEDPLLAVPETGILDLNPLLREYLLLDVPMQPLCRADCRGLCPECGANLNEEDCGHRRVRIDPRWAALKELLADSG